MCSACSGDYENPAMTQPDDLDEQDERDRLVAAIRAEQEQEEILQASRSVKAGTEMLFQALRSNGVIR